MKDFSKYKKISYEELVSKIKPLDIILTSGNGSLSIFISIVQLCLTDNKNGDWSHAAIYLGDIVSENGEKQIFHSTEKGVIVQNFEEWFNSYDGTLSYCKLKNNIFDKKTKLNVKDSISMIINDKEIDDEKINDDKQKETIELIKEFYEQYLGKEYENVVHLSKSLISCWCCTSTKDKIFCSELAGRLFLKLELLDKNIDPETISPTELLCFGILEEPIIVEKKVKKSK